MKKITAANLDRRSSLLIGAAAAGVIVIVFGIILSFSGFSEGFGLSLFGLVIAIVAVIGIAASDKIEYPWYDHIPG